MQRLLLLILIIIGSFIVSFSQTTTPTPPQNSVENDDEIVKISTTLIQVDVSVTDKNGKIVTDLKPEDFEIFENGKKQTITNFSFISSESKTKTIANTKLNKNEVAIPLPPVQLRPEQVYRTIALVVDDLGVSFENMVFVKRAMKKFVDEQMQPNDLVAILRTGGGSGVLQQFTSDKAVLHAAIQKISWNPIGNAGISSFIPFQKNVVNEAALVDSYFSGSNEQRARNFEKMKEQIDRENDFSRRAAEARANNFAIGTLGTLNSVINWMGRMPGKKSVIFFSDGFEICPDSNTHFSITSSSTICNQMTDSLRQLTETANRSTVTIYTQDSRGLATANLSAEDSFTVSPALGEFQRTTATSATTRDSDVRKRQDGLIYLANETGGKSFINTNDYNASFSQALEDQKGYYLIGYQPDSDFFRDKNVKFNKLSVKVSAPDTTVRYRSGFFGVSDSDKKDEKAKQESQQTPAQQIMTAVTSPFAANDIDIKLNSLFSHNDKTGLFINNLVFIDPKSLTFADQPNGDKKANFNILVLVINEKSQIVNSVSKNHNLTVKKDNYQKILEEGFVYTFVSPIKDTRFHQIRVAVQDTVSSKLGSANQFLDIPNLKDKKLALSSLNLESYSTKEWENLLNNVKVEKETDPLVDTASRSFKKGTILSYGLEIFNAKLQQNAAQLKARIRLFKDGELFMENEFAPLPEQQGNKGVYIYKGAFSLGSQIPVGEYVLQVIVQDSLVKEKEQTQTQWTQFEVVD